MTSAPKATILVVDDDRLVLATLSHGLSQAGYDVIDADNGDDAILLARQHRPDLALLDIRMHGKSGFDVADYLREYCPTPFMFLSAFSDAQTAAQVKALGAVAYLVKPLDVSQILPVVAAALDEARRAAPAPAVKPAAPMPGPEVLMAVGVLMSRERLVRARAYERLSRMAIAAGLSLETQAQDLLVELEQSTAERD
ncbi:MAG: response regulator [Pseudomonadota bacterium]|nr:response regulator [Pseudomonadota bacterium]